MDNPSFTEEDIRAATTDELREAISVLKQHQSAQASMAGIAKYNQIASEQFEGAGERFGELVQRIQRELDRRDNATRDGETGWPLMISFLAVSVGATFPMPFGYYQLMRSGLCVLLLWLSLRAGWTSWLVLALPLAWLYNPVAPVVLGSKALWTTINIITLVVIGGLLHVTTSRTVSAGQEPKT